MIRILFSLVVIGACAKTQPATTTPATPAPAVAPAPRQAGEMVGLLARAKILPGKEEELFAALRETAAKVQDTEPGTVVYMFFRNKKDPQELIIFEVYESASALETHGKSAAMAALRPKLGGLVDMATLSLEVTDTSVLGFVR